jgi:endo-1,4-beta-xylanase
MIIIRLTVFTFLFFITACGSSNGNSSTTAPDPAPTIPVTPDPTPDPVVPSPDVSVVPEGGNLIITPQTALVPIDYTNQTGEISVVAVTHPNFSEALQVEVVAPEGAFWNGQILVPIDQTVEQDDVLLIHLFFRTLATTNESGNGFTTVFMEGPAPNYEKYVEREITSAQEWVEYFIPVKVGQSFAANEFHLKFGIGAGNRPQTYQIAGVEVLNYHQTQTLAQLPTTQLSYGGREPDAQWRQAAASRIEQHRKGDFILKISDAAGQPLASSEVKVNFIRHEYHFGSVIHSERLLGVGNDSDKYRETLLSMFNQSGTENDLKWQPWIGEWGESFNQTNTLNALQWLKENHFYTRGHVLVWPSKRNMPDYLQSKLPDNSANANITVKQDVLDHIDDITSKTIGLLDEWDVLNEPFDNHYLMDAFSDLIMVDWFRRARDNLSDQPLYINDYSILSAGGRNTAHQDHYQKTIAYLLEQGAPINGIGLQGHFSDSPTDIELVYQIVERFHSAFPDLAIRATEFDINTLDQQLQADYTRDFLTIMFSHPATGGVQVWGFWDFGKGKYG